MESSKSIRHYQSSAAVREYKTRIIYANSRFGFGQYTPDAWKHNMCITQQENKSKPTLKSRETKAAKCVENKFENGNDSISSNKSSVNTLKSDSSCVNLLMLCGTTEHMNLEEVPNQKNDTTLLAKSQTVISNSTTPKSKEVQTLRSQATNSTSTRSKGKRNKSNFKQEYTSSEVSEDNKEVTYSKWNNEINAHKSKKDSKSSERRSNLNYDSRKHPPLKNTACYIRQGDNLELDYRSKHSLSSKGFSNNQDDTSAHVAEPKSFRKKIENISKADHNEGDRYIQDDDKLMLPTNVHPDKNPPLRNPNPKMKQPLLKFIDCKKGITAQRMVEPLIKVETPEGNDKSKVDEGDTRSDIDTTEELSENSQCETVDLKEDVNIPSPSDSNEPGLGAQKILLPLLKGTTAEGNGKSKDDEIIEELAENSQCETVDPKDVNISPSSDSNYPRLGAGTIFEAPLKGKTAAGNGKSKEDEDDTSCDEITEELSENSQGPIVDSKEDVNTSQSSYSNDSRYSSNYYLYEDEDIETLCDSITSEFAFLDSLDEVEVESDRKGENLLKISAASSATN